MTQKCVKLLTILNNYYVLFSKHDFSLITAELKDTLLKEVGNLKFSDKYYLVTNYALLFCLYVQEQGLN